MMFAIFKSYMKIPNVGKEQKMIVANKKKRIQQSNSYVAVKAQNEIYYQMASIFKVISHDKGELAQKYFNKYLPDHSSEIFLEKVH